MSGEDPHLRRSWADESENSGAGGHAYGSPPSAGYGGGHHADDDGHGGGGPPGPAAAEPRRERPRLHLKPRSKQGVAEVTASSSKKSSSNPFGAARPREEVLKSKGIDAKTIDERIQKKAAPLRLTKDQEEEVEAVRAELAFAEKELQEANEKELPEEKYRVLAETKKKELNDMIADFTKLNVERDLKRAEERGHQHHQGGGGANADQDRAAAGGSGSAPRHFERPSERRRRLEQERADREGGGEGGHGGGGHGGGGYHEAHDDGAYSSFGGRQHHGEHGDGDGDGRRDSRGQHHRRDDHGHSHGGGGGHHDEPSW